jgi:predicted negative regulator of RcsB-dependent stress response
MQRCLAFFLLALLVLADEPPPSQRAHSYLEAVREAIDERRISDARQHLRKLILAVDATPELALPPRELLDQADAKIAAGDLSGAIALLPPLASDAEFAAEAFQRLAAIHLQGKQIDRAMPYIQALANHEASRPAADDLVDDFDAERRTAARIWLRSSQNRSPAGIGTRYLLALVSDDSRALLSELLRDRPDSPTILDALVRRLPSLDMLTDLLPDHPDNALLLHRVHLEIARARLKADRPAEALAQLDVLADISKDETGEQLLLRGDVLLAMGKPGQARLIYSRFLRQPESATANLEAYERLARFFIDSIEWGLATQTLTLARDAFPEHAEFTMLLAQARLGAGDPAAALELIQSAEPTPAAFLLSARAQHALQPPEVAIQTLENGHRLHPADPGIRILLAEYHVRNGNVTRAAELIDKLDAPILQTLAALHRGDLGAASQANRAIRNPESPLARLATGRLLLAEAESLGDADLADSADRILAEADATLAAADRIAANLLAARLRSPQIAQVPQPPWLPLLLVLSALGALAWWIFHQLDDFSVVESRLEEIEASARSFIRSVSPGAEVDGIPLVDLLAILSAFDEEIAPPRLIEELASALACQRVICELRSLPVTERIRFFRIARPIERQLQAVLESLQLSPEAIAATRQQETLQV